MNRVATILLVVLVCASCTEGLQDVREEAMLLVEQGEVPSLAIAVSRSGRVVLAEAYGYADQEARRPATIHTPYPVASITKPVTATGLMVLAERGQVHTDRPVRGYLPDGMELSSLGGDASDATIERVASHTAGLPLHSNHYYVGIDDPPPGPRETVEHYGMITTEPGARYQYSNLGYGLLGWVIGETSRQDGEAVDAAYYRFMQSSVLEPLRMRDAFFYAGGELPSGAARKYDADRTVVPPYTCDTPAASALYASVYDLLRFGMSHLQQCGPGRGHVLSPESIARMQEPVPGTGPVKPWERDGSGCGIGWNVGVTADGHRIVYHAGGTHGVNAQIVLVPKEEVVVVVLSNSSTHWPEYLLVRILESMLPMDAKDFWSSAPVGPPQVRPETLLGPGSWDGVVRFPDCEAPASLRVSDEGDVFLALDGAEERMVNDVTCNPASPLLMNSGEIPLLRGWVVPDIDSEDVRRGAPSKTWVELGHNGSGLVSGALVTFSQRELPTGPLSHWIELRPVGMIGPTVCP